MSETKSPATWKVVIAFILDLLTSFILFGYLIAKLTGNTTENGFQLNGLPALVLFAAVISYMWFMPRFGGRLWQRILGAR